MPHLGCPQNCSFCNQRTISGHSTAPTGQDVVQAVMTAKNSAGYGDYRLQVAFFGGSFTAVDKAYQNELLSAVQPYLKDGTVCGIRISTRPDCISKDHVLWLKSRGVTDIELGAQCLNDAVLVKNDRGHTVQDVVNAVDIIKSCDVNVGLQMMCGLYGSDDETDINTARQIIGLRPSCVRIYPTLTLTGTRLHKLYLSGEYVPPTLQQTIDLCAVLQMMFYEADIPVIRLGLHDDISLKEGYAAGPIHPALGELVQGRIYKTLLHDLIKNRKPGPLKVRVNPSEVSKLIGHKKENKLWLKEIGYDLKVTVSDLLPPYNIECED